MAIADRTAALVQRSIVAPAGSGWMGGLPDFWKDSAGDLSRRRGHDFAIEMKPILLPVRCPTFLKSARGDTESSKRQDHGTNTYMRLRAFAADAEKTGRRMC